MVLRTFAVLAGICLTACQGLEFPKYSLNDHPMYSLDQFKGKKPLPVIMNKYYCFDRNGFRTTTCAFFAPNSASYGDFPSGKDFACDLDALLVHGTGKNAKGLSRSFLEVHLKEKARVFILLNGPDINGEVFREPKRVSGLGKEWKVIRAIRSKNGEQIPISDPTRTKKQLFLPSRAVVLETIVSKEQLIVLPHPQRIKVNGNLVVTRYNLLFAKPDAYGSIPKPFPYPKSPQTVQGLLTGKRKSVTKVQPNKKCPNWLHDLHMTKSRDPTVARAQKELPMWRTWHPPIDPVYWCYYDHEHGAYPGLYSPMFDYTAWKTYDASTTHKRQDESHGGFKVFSFPLHEAEKFIVIVIHMHVAFARRFFTRHHTAAFAVLNKDWELEMELHMKMDFGGAQVTLKNRTTIAANGQEKEIIQSLLGRKVMAGRRFNVLNAADYPANVDPAFLLNCGIRPNANNERQALRGVYEQWKGTLNTCTWGRKRVNHGFNFDVRDASTAMRSLEMATDETKQEMSGDGVNRVLIIPKKSGALRVGTEYCDFDVFKSDATISLEQSEGVFYTDPYFKVVEDGPGKNHVRQFISPEFETIEIRPGKLTPLDPWGGHLEYQKEKRNGTRRFQNIEGSVVKMKN